MSNQRAISERRFIGALSPKHYNMNNYDYPDGNNSRGLGGQQQFYNPIEQMSPTDFDVDSDYPELMRMESTNAHHKINERPHYANNHPVNYSNGYYGDDSTYNHNFYSTPTNANNSKRLYNTYGSSESSDVMPMKPQSLISPPRSNWQPLQHTCEPLHPKSINNSKVHLNSVSKFRIEKDVEIDTSPVSKVHAVVELMNKREATVTKSSKFGNKRIVPQQTKPPPLKHSLPSPIVFDDEKDPATVQRKVANTVKQLQKKIIPSPPPLPIPLGTVPKQLEHLKEVKERKITTKLEKIALKNPSVQQRNSSDNSESESRESIFDQTSNNATENSSIDVAVIEDDRKIHEPQPFYDQSVTATLSKNMASEAKLLMQYFQRRRPLLNFLGVGLSDKLWEQVNEMPKKAVRLVYSEDLEHVRNRESSKITKRHSIRASVRVEPKKVKKRQITKPEQPRQSNNSNIQANNQCSDNPMMSDSNNYDPPHTNQFIYNPSVVKQATKHNLQNSMNEAPSALKAANRKATDREFQMHEETDSYGEDNSHMDYNKDFQKLNYDDANHHHVSNPHSEDHETEESVQDGELSILMEEHHSYKGDINIPYENNGTLQSVDNKSGRFVKKSAAALIAKKQTVSTNLPAPTMKCSSTSSINSRHSLTNGIPSKKNGHSTLDLTTDYDNNEEWRQSVAQSHHQAHQNNSHSKHLHNPVPEKQQRYSLRPAKSVDYINFENNHIQQIEYSKDNYENSDHRMNKTNSYHNLSTENHQNNHLAFDMPRIPPHKNSHNQNNSNHYLPQQHPSYQQNFPPPPDFLQHQNYPVQMQHQHQQSHQQSSNQHMYNGARPFVNKQPTKIHEQSTTLDYRKQKDDQQYQKQSTKVNTVESR